MNIKLNKNFHLNVAIAYFCTSQTNPYTNVNGKNNY